MSDINVCLNEVLAKELTTISQEEGVTVNELVYSVLEDFIDARHGDFKEETLKRAENVENNINCTAFDSVDELFNYLEK